MKKLVGIMLGMLAMALIACPAQADMSYSSFLFSALDEFGAPITDGTYAMVADLNGNGWNGNDYLTQTTGDFNGLDWLWDSSDYLMDLGPITNGEAYPYSYISTSSIPADFTANVDNYYLFWFDKSFGSLNPGNNTAYGVELLGQVGADPGDYLTFPTGGRANLTTLAPEPISSLLMIIGAGVMGFGRRLKFFKA